MKVDPSRFLTTQWAVIATTSLYNAESQDALNLLCKTYWYPLFAFARRQGLQVSDAEDLVQAFLFEFMRPETLERADRNQGRFRTFLLSSFRNHIKNHRRFQNAQKRGGQIDFVSVDANSESVYERLSTSETPEKAFDKAWALICLEQALRKLRGKYEARSQGELFGALQDGLTRADSGQIQRWAEQFGKSPGAIRAALHRIRLDYRDLLRREVAETVTTASAVDDEISSLFSAISP